MMENKEDYKIYSTVEKQEVEWLWYPYIPYGKLTLLQGDPGDGKSTFMINIASEEGFFQMEKSWNKSEMSYIKVQKIMWGIR